MEYTPEEILNIHLLTEHSDLKNVLLAFELIRSRGIVVELIDDIYWIFNRLMWAGENRMAKQVVILFESYKKDLDLISDFSKEELLSVDTQVELKATILNLDLRLLSQRLFKQFPNPSDKTIIRFLFKYGSPNIQKTTLPLLKSREHTGRFLLNLGGLDLKELPEIVLQEKHIQILKIWGNNLESLPDFWNQFRFLEVLNIAENNLKELPSSFIQLQSLQRLYAQNNHFKVTKFVKQVEQLPKINYLSIFNSKDNLSIYTVPEQALLKQIEGLVNHGKVHTSKKAQNLFLALMMGKEEALRQLSLVDLFESLSDNNEAIRKQAKEKILNWKGAVFTGKIPTNASIAILGLVSFATRNRITELEMQGIKFTTELSSSTTHIVLGDFPEANPILNDHVFVFMTEEDLERDLMLRY